jgi:hypothetical protein
MGTNTVAWSNKSKRAQRINHPGDAQRLALVHMGKHSRSFGAFFLGGRNNGEIIAFELLCRHGFTPAPKLLANIALSHNAKCVVLIATRHKSVAAPTEEDRKYILECRKLLRPEDIWITDFVVIGKGLSTYSFADHVEACLLGEDASAGNLQNDDSSETFQNARGLSGVLCNLAGANSCSDAFINIRDPKRIESIAQQAASMHDDTIAAIESLGHLLARTEPKEIEGPQITCVGFLIERLANEAAVWRHFESSAQFELTPEGKGMRDRPLE